MCSSRKNNSVPGAICRSLTTARRSSTTLMPPLSITHHASRIIRSAAFLGLLAAATCSVLAQPANDNFTNAIALLGADGVIFGNNVNATTEPGEPTTVAGSPSGASIWYSWTAPGTGTATFSTAGSID